MATIARLSWDPASDHLPPRLAASGSPSAAAAGDVMLMDADGEGGGQGGDREQGQQAALILPARFALVPGGGAEGGGAGDGGDGRQCFASEGMHQLVRRSLYEWVRLTR